MAKIRLLKNAPVMGVHREAGYIGEATQRDIDILVPRGFAELVKDKPKPSKPKVEVIDGKDWPRKILD